MFRASYQTGNDTLNQVDRTPHGIRPLSIASPFLIDGPLVWLNQRDSGSEKCISTPFSIDISVAGITVELIPIIREPTQHSKVFRLGK